MKEIIIATKNKGKAIEFKQLFQRYHMDAKSLLDISTYVPDVEETGTTFEENARLKAEEVCAYLNKSVIADDSGLVIDALGGEPGVYSARYAGINKTDEEHIDKVLNKLQNIPLEERTARFTCVLAVAVPKKETLFFTGNCEGFISFERAGSNGFGYDPIFVPKGYTETMAQLTAEEKNKISHRNNAIKKLEQWIE